MKLVATLSIALLLGLTACTKPDPSASVSTVAVVVPERNDVTIRTLRFRDVPPMHPQDPIQAIEAFFATRLEWVYLDFTSEEQAKIEQVRAAGILFGGAGGGQLACWIGDQSDPEWRHQLALLDLDGNPVIMPHKRAWTHPHFIGDVSNPAYLEGHIAYYRRYLEFGASSLQRDEVESTVFAAQRYGGGFTPTGLAGFATWLAEKATDEELAAAGIEDPAGFRYDTYLRARNAPVGDRYADYVDPVKPLWIRYWSETTQSFFETVIREVRAVSDRPIAFSCNNTSLQIWEEAHLAFDFAISELLLGSAHPRHIWERSLAARQNGKFQVFGSPKTRGTEVDPVAKNALTRKVIATAYASGSASRVPWDIFQQTIDGAGRYFGEPEIYAPFYAFVRAQDWSGYDDIKAFGPDISPLADTGGLIEIEANPGLYAFLQVAPEAERPVVLHLIDWGTPLVATPPEEAMDFLVEERTGTVIRFSKEGAENLLRTAPQPARLILDPSRHPLLSEIDPSELNLVLKEPAAFTPMLHETVMSTGEFERFVKESEPSFTLLPDGRWAIELPPLQPWGVLEIHRTSR